MKLSLLLQARDEASTALDRVGRAVNRLERQGITRLGVSAERAGGRLDRLGRLGASRLGALATRAQAAAGSMNLLGRATDLAGRGLNRIGGFVGEQLQRIALLAAAAPAALGAAVIRTGMQFEQFEAQLVGTEGTVARARASMAWVTSFAKTTPYELDQVMTAFVAARQMGVDPMNGSLRTLGDAASAVGRSLPEAVEALTDAATGEFERLKAFGITSSSGKAEVRFSYVDKAGMQRTLSAAKGDALAIQRAVLSIMQAKFDGGMIRQSKTLSGTWSNIKDSASGFLRGVGNAGFFDRVANGAGKLLAKIDELEKNGTLGKWQVRISESLSKAFDWAMKFIQETNWGVVVADIERVATAVGGLVESLRILFGWAEKARGAMDWMYRGTGAAGKWLGDKIGTSTAAQEFTDHWNKPKAPPRPGPPRSLPPRFSQAQVGGRLDINVTAAGGAQARVSRLASANPGVPLRVSAARGPVRAAA